MRVGFKLANEATPCVLRGLQSLGPYRLQYRLQSNISPAASAQTKQAIGEKAPKKALPTLSIMPTRLLMRSLLITSVLSSPRLLNICLPLMTRMAQSKSLFLNPDKNPLLRGAISILFYNHFCAGRNKVEVKDTVAMMKGIGFKGVILGYAKDIVVEPDTNRTELADFTPKTSGLKAIQAWRDGNLQTLAMIGSGDFLAIKFTGAGTGVTEALAMNQKPPPEFWQSLLEFCDVAAKQNTRVWIDAEQQVFQSTIDAWTIDLMRHYNRNGKAQIYTTFQAYLKSTPTRIRQHLELAEREAWVLGIKLVRGAYIASEPRHLIHDIKADTDEAYNMIAQSLLTRSFPGIKSDRFPQVRLFLASHNSHSVEKAYSLHKSRILADEPTIELEFGQLQGMADEVSCGLLQLCQKECYDKDMSDVEENMARAVSPKAYKCLAWGSTRECMQFLVRRAVENRSSMDRSSEWVVGLRKELWRRTRIALRLQRAL